MRTKLFKKLILLAVIIGAFYVFIPEKAEAQWDFSRRTGDWVNQGDYSECIPSWWNDECIVTGGVVPHE